LLAATVPPADLLLLFGAWHDNGAAAKQQRTEVLKHGALERCGPNSAVGSMKFDGNFKRAFSVGDLKTGAKSARLFTSLATDRGAALVSFLARKPSKNCFP